MNFPEFPDFDDFEDASDSEGLEFFYEEVSFELANPEATTLWLESVMRQEGKELQAIRFIFCKDAYLHDINVTYLNHDTLTDIITFPYHAKNEAIEGEIYISIDRVAENAAKYQVTFEQELNRILVHGVLHLCGFDDKTASKKKKMTEKENFYLALLP